MFAVLFDYADTLQAKEVVVGCSVCALYNTKHVYTM
jgi:hypothetical protein